MQANKRKKIKKEYISNELVTLLYDNPQKFFSESNLKLLSSQKSLLDESNISIFEHFYSALQKDTKEQIYTNNTIRFFKALKDKLEITLSLSRNSFLHFLCSYKKDVALFMKLLKADCISNNLVQIKNKKGDLFFSELLRQISEKRYKIKNADLYKEFFKEIRTSFSELYNEKLTLYQKCEIFIFINNCSFILDVKPDPNTIITQIRSLPANTLFPHALDYLLNLNTLNYNFLNYLVDKNLWNQSQELLIYLTNTVNTQEVKDYCWVLPHFYYALNKVDLSKPFDHIKTYFTTILNMLNTDTTDQLYKKMTYTFYNVYHYLFTNQSKNSLDNMIKLYELINEKLIKDNNTFKNELLTQQNKKFVIPNKVKQIPALNLIRLYPNAINDNFNTFIESLFEPGINDYVLQTIYMKTFIVQNELQKLKLYYSLLRKYNQIKYNELAAILQCIYLKQDSNYLPLYTYLLELIDNCKTNGSNENLDFLFIQNNCGFLKLQNPSEWYKSEYFKQLDVSSLTKLFLTLNNSLLYSSFDLSQLYLFIFTFISKENAITFLQNLFSNYKSNNKLHHIINKNIIVLYQLVFPETITPNNQEEKRVVDFFKNFDVEELELLFIFGLKGEHCDQLKIKIFDLCLNNEYRCTYFFLFAYLLLNNKTKKQYENIFSLLLNYFDDKDIRKYKSIFNKVIHLFTSSNPQPPQNPNLPNEKENLLISILDKIILRFLQIKRNWYHRRKTKLFLKYEKMFALLDKIYYHYAGTIKGIEIVIDLCCNPLLTFKGTITDRAELYQLLFNGIIPLKIDPNIQNTFNQFEVFYKYTESFDKLLLKNDYLPFLKSKAICSHFLNVVQKKEKETALFKFIIECYNKDQEIIFFATLPPRVILYLYKNKLADLIYKDATVNPFICLLSPYFGNNIKEYSTLFKKIIEVAPTDEDPYNSESKYKLELEKLYFIKNNYDNKYYYKIYEVHNIQNELKQRLIDNLKLLANNIGKTELNNFIFKSNTLQDGLLQLILLLVSPKESPKAILKCLNSSITRCLWNERNFQFIEKFLRVIIKSNCLMFLDIENILLCIAKHQKAQELLEKFREIFLENKIQRAKIQDQHIFFGTCLKYLNNKSDPTSELIGNIIFNPNMREWTLSYVISIDNVEYYVKLLDTVIFDITEIVDYVELIQMKAFKIIHHVLSRLSNKYCTRVGCISNSVCVKVFSPDNIFLDQNETNSSNRYKEFSFNLPTLPFFRIYIFNNPSSIAITYYHAEHVFYFYSKFPIYSIHFLLCTFSDEEKVNFADSSKELKKEDFQITLQRVSVEPHLLILNPFLFLECDEFEKQIDSFVKCLFRMKEPIVEQKINSNYKLSQGCNLEKHNMICISKLTSAALVVNNLNKLINRCGASSLNQLLSQNPTLNELLCQVIVITTKYSFTKQVEYSIKRDLARIYMKDLPALSRNILDKYNRMLFYVLIPWVARCNYISYYDFNDLFKLFIESDSVLEQRQKIEKEEEEEKQKKNNKNNEEQREEIANKDIQKETYPEHIIAFFLKASFLMPSINLFHNMVTLFLQFKSSDLFNKSSININSIINGNLLSMFTIYAIYMNDLPKLEYFLSLYTNEEIKSQFHKNTIMSYFKNNFETKINTIISDNLVVGFVKRNGQLTMLESAIAIGYPKIVNYLINNVYPLNNEEINDQTIKCIISTRKIAMYNIFKNYFKNMNPFRLQVILHIGCRVGNQLVLNYFINQIKVKKTDLFYQSLFTSIPLEYVQNFYDELSRDQKIEVLNNYLKINIPDLEKEDKSNFCEDDQDDESLLKLLVLKDCSKILQDILNLLKTQNFDGINSLFKYAIRTALQANKFKTLLVLIDSDFDVESITDYIKYGLYSANIESFYEFLKKEKNNIEFAYSEKTRSKIERIIIIGDIFYTFFKGLHNEGKLSSQNMIYLIKKIIFYILVYNIDTKVENFIEHFLYVNNDYFMFTLFYLLINKFKYPINTDSLYVVTKNKQRYRGNEERKNTLKEEYLIFLIYLYENETSKNIIKARITFPIIELQNKYIINDAIKTKTFSETNKIADTIKDPNYEEFLKRLVNNEWFSIGIVFINENKGLNIGESEIYNTKEFKLVHFLTNPNNANILNNSFNHFDMHSQLNESFHSTRLNQTLPNVLYPAVRVSEQSIVPPTSFQLIHYHLRTSSEMPGKLNNLLTFYVFESKKNEVNKVYEYLNKKLKEDFKLFLASKFDSIFKSQNNINNSPVIFIDNKKINNAAIQKELITKHSSMQNNLKNNKTKVIDQVADYYETLSLINELIISLDEIYCNLLETFKFLGIQIQFIYTEKSSTKITSMYEKGLNDFFVKCLQNNFEQNNKNSKNPKQLTVVQFPFYLENESVLQPIQINTNLSPNQFLKLLDHVFNNLCIKFKDMYSGYSDYLLILKSNTFYHFGKEIQINSTKNNIPHNSAKTPTFIEYIYTTYILPNKIKEFKEDLFYSTQYDYTRVCWFFLGYLERLCDIEYIRDCDYFSNSLVTDIITYSKENTVPFHKLFTQEMFTAKLFEVDDIISYIYQGKDQYLQPLFNDVYQPIILYQYVLSRLFPEFKQIVLKFLSLREFVDSYINTKNIDVSETNKENIDDYKLEIRKCLFIFLFSYKVDQSLKKIIEESFRNCINELTDKIDKEHRPFRNNYSIEIQLNDKIIDNKVKINPNKQNDDVSPFEFTFVKKELKEENLFIITLNVILKKIAFKGTYKEMIKFYLNQSLGKESKI